MNVIKEILPRILPEDYTYTPDGQIVKAPDTKTSIYFTDDCLFAVRFANANEAKKLLAVAKAMDMDGGLYSLPVAADGRDLLYADFSEAERLVTALDFLQAREPVFPDCFEKEAYQEWLKDEKRFFEQQHAYETLEQQISTDYLRKFFIVHRMPATPESLKKISPKIDCGAYMCEVLKHLTAYLTRTDISEEYSKMCESMMAVVRDRVAEIEKDKTLYGRLENKYKSAFIDTPKTPNKRVADLLYDFCSDDENSPNMTGVYYDPDGYAVATNAHIMFATPNTDKSGKIITKEGKVNDCRPVHWKAVVPDLTTGNHCELKIDINQLYQFTLTAAKQAAVKGKKALMANYIIIRILHPKTGEKTLLGYDIDYMLKFLAAATASTIACDGKLYIANGKFRDPESSPLYYRTNAVQPAHVLIMPKQVNPQYEVLNHIHGNYIQDFDYSIVYENIFDATASQPAAKPAKQKSETDEAKARRIRIAEAEAEAALALLELVNINIETDTDRSKEIIDKANDLVTWYKLSDKYRKYCEKVRTTTIAKTRLEKDGLCVWNDDRVIGEIEVSKNNDGSYTFLYGAHHGVNGSLKLKTVQDEEAAIKLAVMQIISVGANGEKPDRSAEFAVMMAGIVSRLAQTDEYKSKNLRAGISDCDYAGKPSKQIDIHGKYKAGNKLIGVANIYLSISPYNPDDYSLMLDVKNSHYSGYGTGFNSVKDDIEAKLEHGVKWIIEQFYGDN